MKILFFLIAVILQAGGSGETSAAPEAVATEPEIETPVVPEAPATEQAEPESTAVAPAEPASDAKTGLVAEPQEPTGRFTTAVEVRPILQATKTSWVAVRDYEGQDLVYFTHLLAWRCGLLQVRYSVNGGDETAFDLPQCYEDEAQPNAIKAEDGLIFVSFPRNHVQRIDVTVVYDDLGEESVALDRLGMQIP